MPDIIHIDMDCFYAAVEMKDNPDLKGKPVIVGALPGTRGVVSAASYEARKYGVRSALPISQAVKKCPDGVFLFPNWRRYSEESQKIMAVFREYTPLVEPLSVDEAFLDVSGSHRLFGTSVEIGHAIKDKIMRETGLVASVGIAPTKFLAKIASDHGKPNGFVVINEDEVNAFLRPLGAGKLWGVGAAALKILTKAGLHTVGDIADTPMDTLEKMFGPKTAIHLHNLSNGIDERSVEPDTERKQVSNEYTFSVDTSDMEEVERVLLALCDKVASRLLAKGFRGNMISLKLRDSEFKTITRSRSLSKTVMAAEELFGETRAMLRAEKFKGRVRLIGIGVSGFDKAEQTSLFDGDSVRKDKIEEVLSDIRTRFGGKSITRASLIKDKNK